MLDELFPAASYQYILYGMRAQLPQPGPLATRRAGSLAPIAQRTRGMLATLPPIRVYLDAEEHRTLRIRPTRGADLGDAVMSCLIVPSEFRRVQNDYPILFRLTPQRDRFQALAMFGFEPGENLFLDGDRWDARYRPLAMEIQPFLIGHPATPGGDKQVHLDLDSPRIAPGGEGVRVFDDL
eukprot:gene41513-51326_t